MKKYTYYLGLNDKDTKTQKVNTYCTMVELQELVANKLGGGSLSTTNGIFKHADGTIVYETTIKIESLEFRESQVFIDFAKELKAKYNQESVLLEIVEVDAQFI